jgi:hypothetical protein
MAAERMHTPGLSGSAGRSDQRARRRSSSPPRAFSFKALRLGLRPDAGGRSARAEPSKASRSCVFAHSPACWRVPRPGTFLRCVLGPRSLRPEGSLREGACRLPRRGHRNVPGPGYVACCVASGRPRDVSEMPGAACPTGRLTRPHSARRPAAPGPEGRPRWRITTMTSW